MIERETSKRHMPHGDAIVAFEVGHHDRPFDDGLQRQDGGLWLLNDGRRDYRPQRSRVVDGKRAALCLVREQLPFWRRSMTSDAASARPRKLSRSA